MLEMQTANQERRDEPVPPRTLEFRQAMKDFRTMFPTLDAELIECVLRGNGGHVDSTIDQLLQLSQDTNGRHNFTRRRLMNSGRPFNMDDDSTDSEDSIPIELLDPPTSSEDDDFHIRDPPPMYTPRAGEPAGNFFSSTYPVEVPFNDKKKGSYKESGKSSHMDLKVRKKTYKAWNPPMLGTLPEDFLRILPQQFFNSSSKEKQKVQKTVSGSKKRTLASSDGSSHRSIETSAVNRSAHSAIHAPAIPERSTPIAASFGLTLDSNLSNSREENLTPPPRPPRTIQPSSRRIPQNNGRERNIGFRPDQIEHGNLFIRPATGNRSLHHHSMDDGSYSQRHRHHQRSSRSSHSVRCHSSQHLHQNPSAAATNGNHTRRSSDFSSRRMIMVSRSSEPSIPVSPNMNEINGIQSPLNERTSHRSPSQRSSSNHFNHHTNISGHQSPVFHRGGSSVFTPESRSSCRPSTASGSTRSRPRTSREEEQYVEDYRLAILLQNEEFIRELKRNDEFLKELEKDRPAVSTPMNKPIDVGSKDKDVVPLPDPDAKYTHGSRNPSFKRDGMEDPEKEDEKAFKENLKHMGKSARKKFNEIAKKFSVRRKSNYKSMKNIDPVFANCDDDFEVPGPRSPVFDL